MTGSELHAAGATTPTETRRMLDGLFDPYVVLTAVRDSRGLIIDFMFAEANSAACEFNQLPYEELVGSRLLDRLPGHRDSDLFRRYVAVVETGVSLQLKSYAYDHELRGGTTHRFNIQAVKLGDGLSFTWRDVSAEHVSTDSRSPDLNTPEYYRVIAENSLDIVFRTDPAGIITWISPSVRALLGWQVGEVVGQSCGDFVQTDAAMDPAHLLPAAGERSRYEARIRTPNGTWHWMRAYGRPVLDIDGFPAGQIITLQDIHGEVETRTELAYAIHHDPLTGLPNRAAAIERLSALQARSEIRQTWVLCVGIDGLNDIYQAITDTAGEQVLAAVASALRDAVGTGDWVFRGTGDEFLIVLPHSESESTAVDYAQRIIHHVHRPMPVGNAVIDVTVGIGIARSMSVEDPQVVLRRATAAMLQARGRGRGQCGFLDATLSDAVRNRLVTAGELQAALSARLIGPWLQPVMSLHDGTLRGYEALARWETADGQVMPPATFIPIAESTGLVLPLDNQMIARSLQVLSALPPHLHLAVNCSATTLADPGFVGRVTRVLDASGVSPQRLHLEVTETSLLDVTPQIQSAMHALHDRGVTWWVDDFGTGYSSLAHLRDLPVQGLKLDQSFTSALTGSDSTTARLTQGLYGLAAGLDLLTIAEGVETPEQAAVLAAQGWQWGQGWLYGKAGPPPTQIADSDV